jgi:hypothetical protein
MTTPFVRRLYSLQGEAAAPLLRAALLALVGFAGASLAAGALVPLAAGDARPSAAVPLALAGILVLAASWRRAWTELRATRRAES